MDKGRTRGSHISEVILDVENGLHLGKCTIDPVQTVVLQMGSSKISKVSFIQSIIIIIRACSNPSQPLRYQQIRQHMLNIILVPSRRMLLAPPKKNNGRPPFERQEAQAFTVSREGLGGLLKPVKTHTRNPTDLEIPPVWREGAVRQKRLNASGRKLDSDRTFPSDGVRASSHFAREPRRVMSIEQTVSICFLADGSGRTKTPFPYRQKIQIAIPTFQEIESEGPFYAKLNDFRPKFLQGHIIEMQKQCLLKANEELLQQIEEGRQELIIKQRTIEDLQTQLGVMRSLHLELKASLCQQEEERTRKSELLRIQLSQNERLVREVNELKASIKQNMKNIRQLRFSKESLSSASEGVLEDLME